MQIFIKRAAVFFLLVSLVFFFVVSPLSAQSKNIQQGWGNDDEYNQLYSLKDTGIKRGDKVNIKGSWAEIHKEDVFMASKVKKVSIMNLKYVLPMMSHHSGI